MRVSRLAYGFILLCALCVMPQCFADAVNVKKLLKRQWIQMESQHFSAVSDANQQKTTEMLHELEKFNYFIGQHLGYSQKKLNRKLPIILAKNKTTFSALGMPKDIAGVFSSRGPFFIAEAKGFRSSEKSRANLGRAIVLHELVHHLISGLSHDMATPPWFNEGIAEYFGTFKITKEKVILGDMTVLGNRFYSMSSNTGRLASIDVESLFKVTQAELKVGSGNSRKHNKFLQKFYARSAAVVHYINADRQRIKQMYIYLTLIKRGYPIQESFEAAFETDFASFTKEVDNYVSGRWMMARTFPIGKKEGMLSFPKVETSVVEVSQREAITFIYEKLSVLSDGFLGAGVQEKMNSDFERLLPGFFQQ